MHMLQCTSRGLRVTALVVGFVLPLFLPPSLFAADDKVQLLPRWKKEKLHFEIVKNRQRVQDGSVIVRGGSKTDLHIEVLTVGVAGYSLAWILGETRLDDPAQDKNPLTRRLSNLFRGIPIVLGISAEGVLDGVRNWQEIRKKFTDMLNILAEEAKAAGADAAVAGKLWAEIELKSRTREQIEQLSTQEAQMFFLALGKEYKRGEAMRYRDMLPNPFGGEPFPSQAQFMLRSADPSTSRADISWSQSLVPEDSARIMESSLRSLGERLGKPVPPGAFPRSIFIEDAAEFMVDISTGWPFRVNHKRTVMVDKTSQEDVMTISRIGR